MVILLDFQKSDKLELAGAVRAFGCWTEHLIVWNPFWTITTCFPEPLIFIFIFKTFSAIMKGYARILLKVQREKIIISFIRSTFLTLVPSQEAIAQWQKSLY